MNVVVDSASIEMSRREWRKARSGGATRIIA
jgi:hypothetical protein